jgi:hypothetical protein
MVPSGTGRSTGQGLQLSAGPGLHRDVDAVCELLEPQPSFGGGVAQQVDRALTLGVGDTDVRRGSAQAATMRNSLRCLAA